MLLRSIATAVLLLATAANAADWPTWQHDNRRTGATDEQLPVTKLRLSWAWQSATPPKTAWAGPAKWDAYAFHRNLPSMRNYDSAFHVVAAQGRVWFGSSADDTLYCLNADDGKPAWTFTADGPIRLAPTWSDGKVYFGSDDGHARCVDADDGRLVWAFTPADTSQLILNDGRFIPFQPCRTGVTVDNGTAWFACAMLPWEDAWLCSLDAATGKTDGEQHYVKSLPGRTMEGAPALSSKFLVLPQGRVAPRVFDRTTGKDLGEMVKSGGGSVVVVSLDDNVLHGPATDSRKGGFRESSSSNREVVAGLGTGNALVVDGATSWMLTDSEIIASSLTKRNVLWKAACDCPFTMIKAGDTLFVGGDQMVAAHSASDGKLLWKQPVTGRAFGLAVANGRLFASTDEGAIHCFAADETTTAPAIAAALTASSDDAATRVTDVVPIDDKRLLGHWAFQQSANDGLVVKALHGSDVTLSGRPRFSRLGNLQAIELDGSDQSLMVAPDFRSVPVPTTAFTAEAWVKVDQPQDWGGIVSVLQDNGDYERGWLLGFNKDQFCVGVASAGGAGKMTYLKAKQPFETERWYHVAGTYDGTLLRIYVDGALQAESGAQSGEISYPDRTWFEIGAYHDKDEYHRLRGAIHEVALYSEALSTDEIASHFRRKKSGLPAPTEYGHVASGPWLRFTDPHTAVVRWTTETPQPSVLQFGTEGEMTKLLDKKLQTEHQAKLTGLKRQKVYQYRIGVQDDDADKLRFTKDFECDNFFNYSPPTSDRIPDTTDVAASTRAQDLLAQCDADNGLALICGAVDVKLLIQLCKNSTLRFVIADTDAERVDSLRRHLLQHGVYGNQVAVHLVDNLAELPFVGQWANLVILDASADPAMIKEAQRQTQPDGGVTLLSPIAATEPIQSFVMVPIGKSNGWQRFVKPALPNAGDWSHLYGDPDNAAFAGEQLGGAKSTDDLRIQWVGRPGPRYQADRSGRKPSPLSTAGRLFMQGLHRIIAVDAFNGSILWSIEIPGLERFNMPRDCSNWCASRDYLFVAVKGECWKIDAATGDVVDRMKADKASETPMDWGYVATQNGRLFGSSVKANTSWTTFWGGGDTGWYDARSGAVTFPICSDRLFCNDTDSGELTWEYTRGLVLNSTITVGGDTMYFVESRNADIMAGKDRRIGDAALWKDLHLVAIDAATGSPRWEKKLDPMSQKVVFFLAHAADQLTLVSSADKAHQVTSYSDKDGREQWTQSTSWLEGKGDHGKAMSRPAIVGDRVFVRPGVLSLKDGSVLPQKFPSGHGCGTYACSSEAVFFRADTVTMWDPETSTQSDWARLRPDCWLSTIPANGMLLSPEGGGGCSCGSWMETSLGFMPKVFDQRAEP
ncbi:PQQ-binding-like beta-propeller repeat protein [Fuerstiella marisgermanici]|uniref:Serine/threonine-protein kinase AfsK n=1 Tax=Fuerstiella marisgermanici TaxID=1891926 RepID=A0A1P8WEB1_9PLAN|nr:PQQ-binding-like beta-propeller repeat protein [Fuerstiella marisgermanici]APZ92406.1 Serine/threonine-protein kinase AfsK [Fuerstiella marisgermanici]